MLYYGSLEAELCIELGIADEAHKALRTAIEFAQRFDANPAYDANRVRFVTLSEQYSSHDNLGATAMDAVRNMITQVNRPELTAMWVDMCHEK